MDEKQRELSELVDQLRAVRFTMQSPGWAIIMKQLQGEQAKCERMAFEAGTEFLFMRSTIAAATLKGACTVGERTATGLENLIQMSKQQEMA